MRSWDNSHISAWWFPGVTCACNLYQAIVLSDAFNYPLKVLFAICTWIITGSWLRLSTIIDMFGMSSSQPLPPKKIVSCTKSHVFEVIVMVLDFSDKMHCSHPQYLNMQSRSTTRHICLLLYMSQKWAGCSSAQQNRDVNDSLSERAKLSSKSHVGSFE